jgi:two-component system sensor histidine kinase GlrK
VLRLSRNASDQVARLEELNENGSKYWLTRDQGYAALFEAARSGFGATLNELSALELSPEERTGLDSLRALWPRHFPPGVDLDSLITARRRAGGPAFDVWLEEATRELRERARPINEASDRAMRAEIAASIAAARRVQTLSVVSLVTAFLVSVLVFVLVFRSITGPLAQLQRGARAVAGGDFEYRLDRRRSDEFSELADDFNVMTQRLRDLDHAKRDFLSQLSHDLKTPLVAIQDANLLLLDEIPGAVNERQRRLIEHNLASARRLGSMLGKLLDVSRLEAGAVEYQFEACDLHDVIRQAVSEFQSAAERRGIELEADLPERSLNVECDPERVLQVIENLLENAVRYSPEGGVIRIEARTLSGSVPGVAAANGGFALVGVADAGPGVPDEEKNRIFERFHQRVNGRAGGGVGLGLAICREIVLAHGGRIWVSDVPTGGSQFSFMLPVTQGLNGGGAA